MSESPASPLLKDLPKEERLTRMRHSAAHVLAEAMVELMPEAELGIGPPIEDGFYYDFRLPRPSPRKTSSGSKSACASPSRPSTRSSWVR